MPQQKLQSLIDNMPRIKAGQRTKTGSRNSTTQRRAVVHFPYSLNIKSASNQYGSLSTPSFCQSLSRTFEWWSKFSVVPSATSPILSLAAANYYVGFSANLLFSSYSDASAVQRTYGAITTLTAGEWNHWAYTIETVGSSVTETYYRNGVSLGARTLTGGHSESFGTTTYIGTFVPGVGGFNGNIARISMYTRALTGVEIAKLSQNIDVTNGLAERCLFTEGSGSSMTGVNGTTITLSNSPEWQTDAPSKLRTKV